MKIYKYKNYEEYVAAQERGNRKKLKSHSGTGTEVINEIKKRVAEADNIICHGTRGGQEQGFFIKAYPQAYVIGTEISSTANNIPNTIHHDFTKQKDEWIGKFDILYSNSFDHTITPNETIITWTDQLNKHGHMVLEMHTTSESYPESETDPCYYSKEELVKLITDNGFVIIDEWPSPKFGTGKYGYGRPTILAKRK